MDDHESERAQYDELPAAEVSVAVPLSKVDQRGPRTIDPSTSPSLANWVKPQGEYLAQVDRDVAVQCGWGRLLFGHTFRSPRDVAKALCEERSGQRDLALYIRDPQLVLREAPERLFLDPSHTFRIDLAAGQGAADRMPAGAFIRPVRSRADVGEINRLFATRNMVPLDADFVWAQHEAQHLIYLVAEDDSGNIIGTVTGVDHVEAFADPEFGSSLWTLAVDPQATRPGVGQALVSFLANLFRKRGRVLMDLSVLADNESAIALYEKLGFYRVPVFCIKHKHNPVNEPLFTPPGRNPSLNPYAAIIANEARRRGIVVEVVDEERNHFRLTLGARSVLCWESLTELTSSIAMVRCADKRLTLNLAREEGLRVPDHLEVDEGTAIDELLVEHGALVVKPVDGEQGRGVSVDLRTKEEVLEAIDRAREIDERVLVEAFVPGDDLRIVVIDGAVIAAAIRRPPSVVGTGRHTMRELVEKQSRRRGAATGGESRIPLDEETKRCIANEGLTFDAVLEEGREVAVRRTANLHTGGTIHDVTDHLHPDLADAAVRAARVLGIPVVGLDFIVPDPSGPDYVLIEANERPGLANHEPQPTAERFIDFLFPTTASPA